VPVAATEARFRRVTRYMALLQLNGIGPLWRRRPLGDVGDIFVIV
jgi:hypothetical protein